MTAFNPYSGNHACAFEGNKAGLRAKLVTTLFKRTVASIMKNKELLRDLALDSAAVDPHNTKNKIKRNDVELTAYLYKNNFYVECSNTACSQNHRNAVFALSACKEEPPINMPGRLLRAVNKENRQIE